MASGPGPSSFLFLFLLLPFISPCLESWKPWITAAHFYVFYVFVGFGDPIFVFLVWHFGSATFPVILMHPTEWMICIWHLFVASSDSVQRLPYYSVHLCGFYIEPHLEVTSLHRCRDCMCTDMWVVIKKWYFDMWTESFFLLFKCWENVCFTVFKCQALSYLIWSFYYGVLANNWVKVKKLQSVHFKL